MRSTGRSTIDQGVNVFTSLYLFCLLVFALAWLPMLPIRPLYALIFSSKRVVRVTLFMLPFIRPSVILSAPALGRFLTMVLILMLILIDQILHH